MQKNKYKPNRSFKSHRRMARDKNSPRNSHSYEVNVSWKKFRQSFRGLALKGSVVDHVINKWEEDYEASSYMGYTD